MRKIICFLFAVFFCVSFAACGAKSKTPSTESTASDENHIVHKTEVVVQPTASAPQSQKPYAEEFVKFEEAAYEKAGSRITNIKLKFRNISTYNADQIVITIQMLDENGDILDDTFSIVEFMNPDRAGWFTFQDDHCRSSSTIEELAEQVYAVRIVQARLTCDDIPVEYRYPNLPDKPYADFKFENPIEVQISTLQPQQ